MVSGMPAALADQDVGRLHVAMDQRLLVRLGERAADLQRKVDHAARRQRTVDAHQTIEVDAVDVLHRVVEDALDRCVRSRR